ncbi:unnamed protein product [Schistosoma curassoni]|uniref:Reverse transcriptase domain-containing protein n=1 Tax=Schistosoma curassoni TaxID=6186 RepID=A0A183L346_9TREM|nr:unnamed protein product [Schistosoma curassoni]
MTVEKAARGGNMRQFYDTTEMLAGNYRKLGRPVKSKKDKAGFCKDRSCIDQIATLQVIVEQSIECNSSLYINFIDHEKVFDTMERTALWRHLRHYRVPEKIVNIIQLTSRMQLDDLDFTDDLALLSQSQQKTKEKTNSVAAASATILRYNTACINPITIDGKDLEDVKTFTYLGSIIDEHGGSDAHVKARIGQRPNRSTNQCSSWPSFRASNISDATSEKPSASASRKSAIIADSKPFSGISDSSSENRVRINLSELEGHKSSEYVIKPAMLHITSLLLGHLYSVKRTDLLQKSCGWLKTNSTT